MDDKIKKNIIKYNIVSNIINSIIFITIITLLLLVFKKKIVDYIQIIKIGYIFIVINCLFSILIEPFIEIKTRTYKITNKAVEYTQGIFLVSKTVVPVIRIQQVTLTKGPILNIFGLVEVDILTTTSTHKLKHITLNQGEQIVKEITDLIYDKSKAINNINEVKSNE